MIGLAVGTRIWIVAGVTDLRRGFVGLSGVVQTALARYSSTEGNVGISSRCCGRTETGCACSQRGGHRESKYVDFAGILSNKHHRDTWAGVYA
jgi:hypothetical protein